MMLDYKYVDVLDVSNFQRDHIWFEVRHVKCFCHGYRYTYCTVKSLPWIGYQTVI